MDTKQHESHKFLQNHTLAVLSTVSEEGAPWGAAIYYIVGEHDLAVYFLTHASTRKYRNLADNSRAAITVVDNYGQATVQMEGIIHEIEFGEEHDEAFRRIAEVHPPGQFAWVPPVSKMHDGSTVLLKLVPEKVRFSQFNTSESGEVSINDVM